jgi:hypothetical protein
MHDRMVDLDYGLAGLSGDLDALEDALGCPCSDRAGGGYGDLGASGAGTAAGATGAGLAAGAGAAALYGGGSAATGLTVAGKLALTATTGAAAGGSVAAALAPAALIAAPAAAVAAGAGVALSFRATVGNVNRLKAKIAKLKAKIEQEERQRSNAIRRLRIKSWKRQIARAERRLARIERVIERRVERRGSSARRDRVLAALGKSQESASSSGLNLVGQYVRVVFPRANFYRLRGQAPGQAVFTAIQESNVPPGLRAAVRAEVLRLLKRQISRAPVMPAPAPSPAPRGGFVPPGAGARPMPPRYPMPVLPAPVLPAPVSAPGYTLSPSAVQTVEMVEGLPAAGGAVVPSSLPVPSGRVENYDPYSSGIFQPYLTAAPDGSTIDQTAAMEPGADLDGLDDVPFWRRPLVLGAVAVGAFLVYRARKGKGKGKGKGKASQAQVT